MIKKYIFVNILIGLMLVVSSTYATTTVANASLIESNKKLADLNDLPNPKKRARSNKKVKNTRLLETLNNNLATAKEASSATHTHRISRCYHALARFYEMEKMYSKADKCYIEAMKYYQNNERARRKYASDYDTLQQEWEAFTENRLGKIKRFVATYKFPYQWRNGGSNSNASPAEILLANMESIADIKLSIVVITLVLLAMPLTIIAQVRTEQQLAFATRNSNERENEHLA